MTDPFAAAAAIARVPGVEPAKARYRLLSSGFTNTLWQVDTEERRLVLRLDTVHAGALGLDRGTELAVLEKAGAAGLAPRVMHAEPQAGVLVYEFLPGRSWTVGDLASRANLEALAALLRQVHALPRSGVPFDAPGAAERYLAILQPRAEFSALARRCRDLVARVPPPAEPACCHNDVIADNVIAAPAEPARCHHDVIADNVIAAPAEPARYHHELVAANAIATPALRLLDWEYACDNDPLFDLASLIGYHDLDQRQADTFLGAYSGSSGAEPRERLDGQLRLFDALQWLWLAVRQAIAPTDATRERLQNLAGRLRP